MKTLVTDPGPPVGEKEFRQVEKTIGRTLPADYRDFLRQTNGGTPLYPLFKLGRSIQTLHDFMRIEQGSIYDLLQTRHVLSDRIDETVFLPIAETTFGDGVCLNLKTGAAYFWVHDQARDQASYVFDRMDYLAPSFTAFAEMLYAEVSRETRDPMHRLGKTGGREDLAAALATGQKLVTADGLSVGEIAAMHGNIELLDEWLKRGQPSGRTLHIAAMNGRMPAVDHLLSLGFDINQLDNNGKTPLDAASWEEEYAQELRRRGAKPSAGT
jgi:hypothetical protein